MFRDTQEELNRLENALLAEEEEQRLDALLEEFLQEEEEDELLASILKETDIGEHRSGGYQNYANNYGRTTAKAAYNSDKLDTDLESYSEDVRTGAPESLKGLIITACALSAGIVAVVLFWIFRYFV